jgi:lipopolysaccharide transport system permease protein
MYKSSSDALPAKPIYRNVRSRSWSPLNLRALWAYRELLFFLIWRDVKVRYKQTLLGVAWVILQPLLTVLIFTAVFNRLARIPGDGIPYFLFSYAGLLPWMFFANAVANSGQSLVANTNLITKVYFPRMLIPAASVGASVLDLAISLAVLIWLTAYWGGLTWRMLMLPALVALTVTLALGVGMLASALNLRYKDVRFVLPFLVQLWMLASPVIYPSSMVPEAWRKVLMLNPLMGIIEGFRAALYSRKDFDWPALAAAAGVVLAMLVYSAYVFRRMERSFADLI